MGCSLGWCATKGNFMTKNPVLWPTFRFYYQHSGFIIKLTNHYKSLLSCPVLRWHGDKMWLMSEICQVCQSAVNLSCPSDVKKWQISEICHLKPWSVRNLDRSIHHCRCQVSELSKMTGFREECPSDLCPHALICQIWHLSDEISHFRSILTICSSRIVVSLERKVFIPPSLPPPPFSYSCPGVSVQKSPLSLYSQKARIPGLRECVGVIIPNPCTLNGTFHRDLNPWPVVHVA